MHTRAATWGILTVTAGAVLIPWWPVQVVAGYALLVYWPGRLLLAHLGIERDWSAAGTALLSLAVSLAAMPVALHVLWHATHHAGVMLAVVWLLLVVLAAFRPGLATPACEAEEPPPWAQFARTRWLLGLLAVIIVLSVVLPYWPTNVLGHLVPASIHDFIKHHGVLFSLERRSLPLGSVFYADAADGPVYYYHLFYLIPATARLWTAHTLSIELAFTLSSALVGLATTGVAYTLTRRLTGHEGSALLTAWLVGALDALDIIPWVHHMVTKGQLLVVLDSWAAHAFRVHNPLNQMTWSPQNVSGLLVVLTGAYLLSARPRSWGWLIWGPVGAFAVLGSSIWVAAGSLPALGLWALTRRRQLLPALLVGVLMAAACGPLVAGYRSTSARHGKSLTLEWPRNEYGGLGRLVEPGIAANLLDLPTTIPLEFGAKALLLVVLPGALWRRAGQDAGMRWLMLAAGVSILGFCIARSHFQHNDFGQKIMMVPLAVAAILAGGAVAPRPPGERWSLGRPMAWSADWARRRAWVNWLGLLVLAAGLPLPLWEAPLTAVRRHLEERQRVARLAPDQRSRLEAEWAALRFIRDQLPPDAVVQGAGTRARACLPQLIHRQLGVMEPQDDVMVFDPPDRDAYVRTADEVLTALRDEPHAVRTAATLARHGITHVLLGTVELDNWHHLERFDDPEAFTTVWQMGPVRVVAVRQAGETAPISAPD